MSDPHSQQHALLVVAAFSRHLGALTWAKRRLEQDYGAVDLVSPAFTFNQTDYYTKAMGPGLSKQFHVFRNLIGPERLADIKRHTCKVERELTETGAYAEDRPVNLDPGLLMLGKFVLATTKDQAHRIYLRDGIFAEVTLRYQGGEWQPWPWTYADYREAPLHEFLQQARDFYQRRIRETTDKEDAER